MLSGKEKYRTNILEGRTNYKIKCIVMKVRDIPR